MIDIGENLENFYNSEEISSRCSVFIADYDEPPNAYGLPYFSLILNVTVRLKAGFVNSLNITFAGNEDACVVMPIFSKEFAMYSAVNLTVTNWKHNSLPAFISMVGVKNTKGAHFRTWVNWILHGERNQSYNLEVTMELTYFNGTTYKKLIQPFKLEVTPDNNDSFQTATEVVPGKTYSRLYIDGKDADDYYKVYVNEGHQINITIHKEVVGIEWINLDVFIYDSRHSCIAYKELEISVSASLVFTANSTGYYYVRVHALAGHGFYNLTVTEKGDQK